MTQQTNQRDIRFRALYEGVWYYQTLEEMLTITLAAFRNGKHKTQFSGLQDKNKKDVYEGDKTSDGVIEFNVDTCCYIIRRPNKTFIRLDIRKDNIEIIGNIYQS